MPIVLNPTTGLRDETIFPDEPGSSAAAREQIQSIIDQVAQQAAATSDFTSSLNVNGWKRNNIDGTIEQWGTYTALRMAASEQSYLTINFPMLFPEADYNFICDIYASDINGNVCAIAKGGIAAGLSNAVFRVYNTSINTATDITIKWRAIGR